MRAVRLRSSRKFWPSCFLALSPCRAMTSRSGGRLSIWLKAHRARRQPGRQSASAASMLGACERLAGAGQIERRAVIGRGAHDRQAEGDVDALVERDGLDRDQRLIVIHGDHRIVFPPVRQMEDRVRRERARRHASRCAAGRRPPGAMMSRSSVPMLPLSPACGLRPVTAICGSAMPKRVRRSCSTISTVSRISLRRDQRRAPRAAARGWSAARRADPRAPASSPAVALRRRVAQSAARYSVWPGYLNPAL